MTRAPYRDPAERTGENELPAAPARSRRWALPTLAIALVVAGTLAAGHSVDLGQRYPGSAGLLGAVFVIAMLAALGGVGIGIGIFVKGSDR